MFFVYYLLFNSLFNIKASSQGQKEIAQLLIDKGADVNSKANDETTGLIFASMFGHKEIVQLLIARGADINAKANSGMTALIYGILEICVILVIQ